MSDASVGWTAMLALHAGYFTAFLEPAAARSMYADLDAFTGGVTKPTGTAVVVPGGYRVSGRWTFGSCCHANEAGVQAVTLMYKTASGTALYASHPLDRWFRDIHTASQHFVVYGEDCGSSWQGVGRVETGRAEFLGEFPWVPVARGTRLV